MDTTLNRLRKKLERWELEHLRQHAADLSDRVDRAEESAHREATNADYWRDQCEDMWKDMHQGGTLGLMIDGRVIALANYTLISEALLAAERHLIPFGDDAKEALASVRAALVSLSADPIPPEES